MQPTEIRGLIVFLTNLLPDATPPVPLPKNEQEAVFGVPVQAPTGSEIPASWTLVPDGLRAETAAEPQPTTRKRRTKAEMMAAEEAAKLATQTLDPPAAETVNHTTPTVKPASGDELRSLLNAYIQKHSMELAIDKLKAFGCNRVSEALVLEPAKLNELVEALRG
jgi:hypothetical protein